MTTKTAETIIRELAARHGVAVQRTALDDWADDATRLSGDDGVVDEVGELVIALRRAQAGTRRSRPARRRTRPHVAL